MAATRSAAVVLLNEFADDSAILETTSCDDDEFLFLLMISSKERKNRIRINSYFERTVPLYRLFSNVKNCSHLYGNFVVKPTVFVQATSTICTSSIL